jgi:hypothetical protein
MWSVFTSDPGPMWNVKMARCENPFLFVRILNKWHPLVSLMLRYHPSIPASFWFRFFFFDCTISPSLLFVEFWFWINCLDLYSVICFFYGVFVFKFSSIWFENLLACFLQSLVNSNTPSFSSDYYFGLWQNRDIVLNFWLVSLHHSEEFDFGFGSIASIWSYEV